MRKQLNPQEGFTLIEMMIVVAVVAILAGVVLTGITGFQASARDSRRISDMKNAQNLLEVYFNRCGHYPGGTSNCATGDTLNGDFTSWDDLADALDANSITKNLPEPPAGGKSYMYWSNSSDGNTTYVMGAELERESTAARSDSDDFPSGYADNAVDCENSSNDALFFCVTSN